MIKKERRQQHGASLFPYSVISPFFFPSTFSPQFLNLPFSSLHTFSPFLSPPLPYYPSTPLPCKYLRTRLSSGGAENPLGTSNTTGSKERQSRRERKTFDKRQKRENNKINKSLSINKKEIWALKSTHAFSQYSGNTYSTAGTFSCCTSHLQIRWLFRKRVKTLSCDSLTCARFVCTNVQGWVLCLGGLSLLCVRTAGLNNNKDVTLNLGLYIHSITLKNWRGGVIFWKLWEKRLSAGAASFHVTAKRTSGWVYGDILHTSVGEIHSDRAGLCSSVCSNKYLFKDFILIMSSVIVSKGFLFTCTSETCTNAPPYELMVRFEMLLRKNKEYLFILWKTEKKEKQKKLQNIYIFLYIRIYKYLL